MVFHRKSDINSNSGATAGCRGCGCLSCFGGSKSSNKYRESPTPEDKYEKEKETNIRQTPPQIHTNIEDRLQQRVEILEEEEEVEEVLDNSQHQYQQQVCQSSIRRNTQHEILVEEVQELCHQSHNEMKVRVNMISTTRTTSALSEQLTTGFILSVCLFFFILCSNGSRL